MNCIKSIRTTRVIYWNWIINCKSSAALLLILLLAMNVGCSEEKSVDPSFSKLLRYIKEPNNLEKPAYLDSFQTNYDRFLQSNEIEKAAELLGARGDLLDLIFQADTTYIETTESFLAQYENDLSNEQKISLNYFLGSQYDFLGNISKSDFYLKKTNIPTENRDEIQMRAFGGLLVADHYKKKGAYYEAMTQMLKTINDFDAINDTLNLSTSYNNLSLIYKNLKVYDESEKCIQKSLQLSKGLKDTLSIWTSYINLARPNSLDVQPEKCLYYARLVKRISESWKGNTNRTLANTNASYARALLLVNKLDSVEYYLNEAEKYVNSDDRTRFDIFEMRAELELGQGKQLPNRSVFEQEYAEAKRRNDIPLIEILANILSDDAKNRGDFPKAYGYLQEKYNLRDSSWMNDTKLNLIFLDKKFQFEKKEKIIAQQQLKIAQTNSFIYGMALLVFVLLSFWIVISVRKKRKRAERETYLQEQFTFQLLQTTEEERARIANELHDSVNHELLTIKNALVNGKDVEIAQVAAIIEEVRSISRNLHPAVLETIGLEASIEQLCERLTENGLFVTAEIDYQTPQSKSVELQFYRIIQEALNNTLKHGNANAAKVSLTQTESTVFIEIKDNGAGFNVEDQLNNPKSFGLHSLFQRAKSIASSLTISSSEKGTSIQLVKSV